MKKTEEKGITLIALVITIVLLLILSTIGINAGNSSINSAKFTEFKSELEILQRKVNELNNEEKFEIGRNLTTTEQDILKKEEISKIIYENRTSEEENKIKEGFRYCDSTTIKNELGIENIKKNYLINVEYRYIIYEEGYKYDNKTYYMLSQMDSSLYNVDYKDKNEKTGDFEVISTKEDNRWKIEVKNINHSGYVNIWQVKYKMDNEEYWNTSNSLSFYVTKKGRYHIKVVHGDEIDLGTKTIETTDEE